MFDFPHQDFSRDQCLSACHYVSNMAEFQISQLRPIMVFVHWVNSQSHVYVTLNEFAKVYFVLRVYSLKTEDR